MLMIVVIVIKAMRVNENDNSKIINYDFVIII